MKKAKKKVCKLWADEFANVRAYAYRATQGILAGQENPVFPSVDTLEEISADAIAIAFEATTKKPVECRESLLGFVRNGCRNAVKSYRRSQKCGPMVCQSSEESEGLELLLSLIPPKSRAVAEQFAMGKDQVQVAESLGVDRTTIYRHVLRIRKALEGVKRASL